MWLNSTSHAAKGLPLKLQPGEYVIGRDRECQVVLHDLSVSRRHARLTCLPNGSVTIEDLKSRNQMFVNDARVARATLRPNDRVRLGAIEFVVAGSPLAFSESAREDVSTARVRLDDASLQNIGQKLTATQQKVLRLLLDGLDEHQIAGRCGCRPRTAHNHIQAIYRALDVHSRQQLLARFLGATNLFSNPTE